MAGFDNETAFFTGIDNRGVQPVENQMVLDGQLIIGATASPNMRIGQLASADASITYTFGAGTIDLSVDTRGTPTIPTNFQSDSGVAIPAANVINLLGGSNGIDTSAAGNTVTFNFDVTEQPTIPTSIVTDSGTVTPAANSFSVLGRSGSKVSASGSVMTVKSPPYADASASATSSLNTGEFLTGAYTRTLPASASLQDGDLIEYVCTTADDLIIQAVGAQKIRFGTLLSSAAGTLTSTAIGDSVSLRFRATDGFWYVTSSIGTWVIA